MNIQFLQNFINEPENAIPDRLKSYSDELIADIAEAYFLGRDGEYNRSYTYTSYNGSDGVREKLLSVSPDTLVGMIKRVL